MAILYLCDGKNKKCNNSPECYLNSDSYEDCYHTINRTHSKNYKDHYPSMSELIIKFIRNKSDDFWERND